MRAWALHGAVAVFALALAGVAGAAAGAIHARSPAEGVLWVLVRGEPGAQLPSLLRGEARLVNAWAGGRVLQVHAPALQAIDLPRGSAWAVLPQPATSWTFPGCG